MNRITIGDNVTMDLARLIESRAVFLANSGSGKSWLIRRVAEQVIGQVQTIILDPEGEFASLREKCDVVLCGKGQDVPVEIRSAAMLATKLLELGTSAVVDLYELHPQERQRYVKLFCDALVNCPKELYHPVIVILDEAHEYVPEGKPSEATWAVEALASKGRKRGQCLILASQRISKLSKNAAAECNNKLIGRASQDIDMKRAGDELGMTKDRFVELRRLKPGEFFAFGPAIADEVTKVTVGPVSTSHAKVGYKTSKRTPPPSAVIRRILGGLKDLPAEAEAEAKTIADLKRENADFRRHRCPDTKADTKTTERAIKEAVRKQDIAFKTIENGYRVTIEQWAKLVAQLRRQFNKVGELTDQVHNTQDPPKDAGVKYKPEVVVGVDLAPAGSGEKSMMVTAERRSGIIHVTKIQDFKEDGASSALTGPEQRILNAIAWLESIGVPEPEQTAVAFLAGYTFGGGGFNNPKGSLRTKGLIEYRGPNVSLTDPGRSVAVAPESSLTTEELHRKVLAKLPGPEQRILRPLLAAYPEPMSNDELAAASGYASGSGGFNNPKGRLRTIGLIEYPLPNHSKARDILFL